MRATAEALEEFGPEVKSWTLLPSKGGVFELTVNGELIFSKKALERHMEEKEIIGLLKQVLDSL